jgi:transcriptional regulator with XRE-family HTH domain
MTPRRLDAKRLRALRTERGMTQWDLALAARVGVAAIRNAERGRTYLPYPETLRRYAKALGCTVDDLLTKEDAKATGP